MATAIPLWSCAEEPKSDIIQPRRRVANFCRDLVNSLKLERVEGRRKTLFFGHHFLYAPNHYIRAPHMILKPVEAQGKKGAFGPALCLRCGREHYETRERRENKSKDWIVNHYNLHSLSRILRIS